MARTDNLTNFLTDIASSIKTKKGYDDSTKINAANFDTEINSIKGASTVYTDLTPPNQSIGGKGDIYVYYVWGDTFYAPLNFVTNGIFNHSIGSARYNLTATSITKTLQSTITATVVMTLEVHTNSSWINGMRIDMTAQCGGKTKNIVTTARWEKESIYTYQFTITDVNVRGSSLDGGIFIKLGTNTTPLADVNVSVPSNIRFKDIQHVYQKTTDTEWKWLV